MNFHRFMVRFVVRQDNEKPNKPSYIPVFADLGNLRKMMLNFCAERNDAFRHGI